MTNMDLARIVKEQLANNKKLKASLDQRDKESQEKDRLMKTMMERIAALENRDKSMRQDEEVVVEEEEENQAEKPVDPKGARMAKLVKAIKSGDVRVRTNLPMYGGKMDD